MAKCLPGMTCYEQTVYYPTSCVTDVPPIPTYYTSSDRVTYKGANLPYTGIQTDESLTEALQKIDALLSPEELVNAVIQAIQNDDTLRSSLCTALNCT